MSVAVKKLFTYVFGLFFLLCSQVQAQEPPRVVQFVYTPAARAQIAIWIETPDQEFKKTVFLTEAVGTRGIGNRPGALQMNSGFRWPYGRREGVLPIWAHKRAHAPGAQMFRTVIFQDRTSEGYASRTSTDHSTDNYFCLSFDVATTKQDALDAVTCASVFSSDKGRFLTENDSGYAEPIEDASQNPPQGSMYTLDLHSYYPPRRDVSCEVGDNSCTQPDNDHDDVRSFAAHAREVIPDIDVITGATPDGLFAETLLFSVPNDWPNGEYVAWLEINIEGDYNNFFNDSIYPTPETPDGLWDTWAITYGYPYRGQPSVVFRLPFSVGTLGEFSTSEAHGYASLTGRGVDGGDIYAMSPEISNDPQSAPSSGVDRLRMQQDGSRLRVVVGDPASCEGSSPPSEIGEFMLQTHDDIKHAHEWAHMSFEVPQSQLALAHYEVRVGTEEIVDEDSFFKAIPAKAATLESQALRLPMDLSSGSIIETDFGGLVPETNYYVAIRAVDVCNQAGPLSVAQVQSKEVHFTTVSPCFVATAAYGTPFAADIAVLRQFRDKHLRSNWGGRVFVRFYERVGPHLAKIIRKREWLRAAVRWSLKPLVSFARWLEDSSED